ncbi:MAG: hypothetical protein LC775_15220 [Acidobacteria bacterium]|nr:hypothetical protein [Acidobacteriota bacterium]
MGSEIRGRSSQLESVEGPGRGSGQCPGGQAEMREDPGDQCSMAAMMVGVPPHCGHRFETCRSWWKSILQIFDVQLHRGVFPCGDKLLFDKHSLAVAFLRRQALP